MKHKIIFISCLLASCFCTEKKKEFVVPTGKIINCDTTARSVFTKLRYLNNEHCNTIQIEMFSNKKRTIFLNNFYFPRYKIVVEKKINNKFVDISTRFFDQADSTERKEKEYTDSIGRHIKEVSITLTDGIIKGEGNSTVPDKFNIDYMNDSWFKSTDIMEQGTLQYFEKLKKKYENMDKECISTFIECLKIINIGEKSVFNLYINKTFPVGTEYKIYISYPRKERIDDTFCFNLFDSLPTTDKYEPYRDKIISDTLYLICK